MRLDAIRPRPATLPGPSRTPNWLGAAVASVVGFALLGGCGGVSPKTTPVAQVVPAVRQGIREPFALQGTQWELVRVQRGDEWLWARPNLDSTLVVDSDGKFLLNGCNNVAGSVVPGPDLALFDGGTITWRHCPGVEGQIDGALAKALQGSVAWAIHDRSLELRPVGSGLRLQFRVKDVAQPPVSAATVATVLDGRASCRILVGATEAGERLYALAQTRRDGPWRLLPGGPAAPAEGPVLATQLLDESSRRRCVTGFAPAGATEGAFGGTGVSQNVALYRVPGIEAPAYAAVVPAAGGILRFYDENNAELASWPTTKP